MTDEDGYDIDEEEVDEAWRAATDNVWDWLCCPCDRCMFHIGLAAAWVPGFAPRLVVEQAVKTIAAELADDDRDLPEGVDILALNTLMPTLFPPGDDDPG